MPARTGDVPIAAMTSVLHKRYTAQVLDGRRKTD